MPLGRQYAPSCRGGLPGTGQLNLYLQLLRLPLDQGLLFFQDTHLCRLRMAKTQGPTRPLRLAVGGLGRGLPKIPTLCLIPSPSLLLDYGNKTQLEIKHEHPVLLTLLPSFASQGWGPGENQASGAASCPLARKRMTHPAPPSSPFLTLLHPHSLRTKIFPAAPFDFYPLLQFIMTPKGQFTLEINSSILNDEHNFAGIFKNICICKNNLSE